MNNFISPLCIWSELRHLVHVHKLGLWTVILYTQLLISYTPAFVSLSHSYAERETVWLRETMPAPTLLAGGTSVQDYYRVLPMYEPVSSMLSLCMHCAIISRKDLCICKTGNLRESQNKTWLYLWDWQPNRFACTCHDSRGDNITKGAPNR